MRYLSILAAVAALVVATDAGAGKTQVDSDSWKAAGRTGHIYGRSDGVFQEDQSGAPYIVENGSPAHAAGFGYMESFTPNQFAAVPSALMTVAGLVYSAAAQQLDIAYFGPHVFIFGQSTAQTILPVITATGLDIGTDQVSAEAIEMFAGVLGASGRPAVVGWDPAFYFCATLTVVDASGASDLHVGWRSATQTQVQALGTYLNFATIGLEGTSNPNTIQIMTSNDDTEVTTDTTDTWADAASKKLCTNVSAAGVATYTINGAAPTTTVSFTFDDGDSLIPFIAFEHGADVAGAVTLTEWEVGYTQ